MSQKTDVVVKLVLVFFVSLLSFSIGTYVGRKYSDNQHKMAQLEPGSQETAHSESEPTREVASENSEGTTAKAKDSLSDEEIAKLAEEFVADDAVEKPETAGHGDSHAEVATKEEAHGETAAHSEKAAHAEKAAKTETAAAPVKTAEHGKAEHPKKEVVEKAGGPTTVAQQIAAGNSLQNEGPHAQKAPKATENSRIPSSIPKDVAQYSVGKFTVQVASYTTTDEAEKRSHELQEKGYKAFVIPVEIKGKSWFRVSVGLFATEKEAKDYKSEFLVKAKVDSAMVQKISR